MDRERVDGSAYSARRGIRLVTMVLEWPLILPWTISCRDTHLVNTLEAREPRGAGNEPKRERMRCDGSLPSSINCGGSTARKPRRPKGWCKDQLHWKAHYRNALDPGEQRPYSSSIAP